MVLCSGEEASLRLISRALAKAFLTCLSLAQQPHVIPKGQGIIMDKILAGKQDYSKGQIDQNYLVHLFCKQIKLELCSIQPCTVLVNLISTKYFVLCALLTKGGLRPFAFEQ